MKKIALFFALNIPLLAMAQLADSSKRLVPVKGAHNFRDVGGYKTTDGREVKWGKVYRSASINHLTDDDMALMESKGIKTVIDFRGKAEAAAAPDRLNPNTDYTLSPAGSDSLPNPKQIAELLKNGDFLIKMYGEEGLKYFGDRYRPMFVKLLTLDNEEALMYHCTGGRDRTGMATALFLYILGVPKDVITEDFVASNVYLKPIMGSMLKPLSQMSGLSEEEVEHQMALRPELLKAFFEAISKQYGSIENFMLVEMGIGSKEITLLKANYTTKL